MNTENPQQPAAPFKIPSLDGIRAIAIIIVLLAHAGLADRIPGGFGVTVFFFLSGFLISTLLRREFAKKRTINFRGFYMRRLIRIFPPFYGALALCVLLTAAGALPGSVNWKGVGLLAAHIGNYAQLFAGNALPMGSHVYWSLAVEEHFYLTFPLLALWLFRKDRKWISYAAFAFFGGGILLWRLHLVQQGAPVERTYLATDTRFDAILWGCALALLQNPMFDRPLGAPTWLKLCALFTSGIVLFYSLMHRDPAFRETYRYTVQSLALAPVFYLSIRDAEWSVFKWLEWQPVRYLGLISYTLYLVHHTLIYSCLHLFPELPSLLNGALGVAASLGLAAVSYRYVERPLGRLRKRYN